MASLGDTKTTSHTRRQQKRYQCQAEFRACPTHGAQSGTDGSARSPTQSRTGGVGYNRRSFLRRKLCRALKHVLCRQLEKRQPQVVLTRLYLWRTCGGGCFRNRGQQKY